MIIYNFSSMGNVGSILSVTIVDFCKLRQEVNTGGHL